MATPETTAGGTGFDRRVVIATVIAANLLLALALPILSRQSFGADLSEPPVRLMGGQRRPSFDVRNILRNETSTRQLFDAVRRERAILFIGTSESAPMSNLGAQLNAVMQEGPRLVVTAMMGLSPIHGALLFARTEARADRTPPLILILNPVYMTRSHDGINEGWMGSVVRSPVFLMMNHEGLLDALPADVRSVYQGHFAGRRALLPLYAQQYAGSLIYLAAHRRHGDPFEGLEPPMPAYTWDGTIPDYDEERAVHRGYVPSDALAKDRWEVQTLDESMNLKGLRTMTSVLRRQEAPALLLVLPVNRAFYAANGRDMQRFDQRYRDLRAAVAAEAAPGHLFVIDMFEKPGMKLGFEDRMHQDAYGFHQLATWLARSPEYREFLEAVEAYYAREASGRP